MLARLRGDGVIREVEKGKRGTVARRATTWRYCGGA
jgi:hypothetical protein